MDSFSHHNYFQRPQRERASGVSEGVFVINSQGRTRSNGYKLDKPRFRTERGRHWFTNRVVNDWNRLDKYVVSAESIGSFKKTVR